MNTKPSRIRTTVCSLAVATVLGTATAPAAVAALNTAQIIASAVSQNCISWRVSGICYWLFCTPFGCKVRTSVKVTHFIPQTVVSTYVAPGGNPWQEMAFVSQTAGGLESAVTSGLSGVSAGGANPADMKNPGQRKSAVRFKYADAIGHPATSLIGGSIPGYSCDTAATPLMPYFLSTLDSAAWRTGVPESLYPEALVTMMRKARDAGIALPVAGVAISPWANLTHSGFSATVRDGIDPLCRVAFLNILARTFLAGALPTHPDASPVFADVHDLAPILIQIGENEVMLSDAIRLASNLGEARVRTSLEVWPGMFHVWHLLAGTLPEADQALRNAVRFLDDALRIAEASGK